MSKITDDKKRRGGEVIHVVFGAGGGRRSVLEAKEAAKDAATKHVGTGAAGIHRAAAKGLTLAKDPVTDVFSPREVARLFGLSESRLRRLDREDIVRPSGTKAGRRAYTFADLIAIRATRELFQSKVRIGEVVKAIGALKRGLPRIEKPLQQLRVSSDGARVVVRLEEGEFEPTSGQMLFDFQVQSLRDDVVRLLRPQTPEARARTAFDLYLRGSALDESEDTSAEAEKLYRHALELDPNLAIAYTNLGNLTFRRGQEKEAEELYRRALEVDEGQPEAHYNLGYVMLERGQPSRAIAHFQRAIDAEPRFADAHFNLAMALEAIHQPLRAASHWKKYLELEPQGPWSDLARDHLK